MSLPPARKATPFKVETLADVNKRRHRRIERPERAGHPRADMRRRDRLRRDIQELAQRQVDRIDPRLRFVHDAVLKCGFLDFLDAGGKRAFGGADRQKRLERAQIAGAASQCGGETWRGARNKGAKGGGGAEHRFLP